MPVRTVPFGVGEYYHIYNRGVAFQPTYSNKRDYERFLLCLGYYRHVNSKLRLSKLLQLPKDAREELLKNIKNEDKRLVDIVAFCLMPNHFHLLIKQNNEDGISRFLRLAINSYVRYFNTKHKRVGALYQGMFKAVHIQTQEQLLHVSRYIHLNPLVSYVVSEKDFIVYPWSSLQEYQGDKTDSMVNPEIVLENFSSYDDYMQFVFDQADYGKELDKIKHLTLE